MKLQDLSPGSLLTRARSNGLRYQSGPFSICLFSALPEFLRTVQHMYGHIDLLEDDAVCHFHVRMERSRGLRGRINPQVQFSVDGMYPFEPYPLDHAFPMYEWCLNWCIGTTGYNYLILHSAVAEKRGHGVILPAMPGSGKSTLCAGLVANGWRLLSDEFGIVRPADGQLLPIPRAAPLKNQSIDIITDFAPHLALGPQFDKTRKGDVRHMLPPRDSLERQRETVSPRWVVFPRYRPGAELVLEEVEKSMAFVRVSNNCFNYQKTMEQGFNTLTQLIRNVDCYNLQNGDLKQAVDALELLLEKAE